MHPVNIPLPTRIVTAVPDPIDVEGGSVGTPEISVVDAHVRAVMQHALDDLAAAKPAPVTG